MNLFLDKLLPVFVYPLGAALLLGLVALVLSFTNRKVLRSAVLAVALVGLWVASTPLFAGWLVAQLEAQYPPIRAEDAPTADAIIVLGGIVNQPLPPRVTPELSDAADRIVDALRLYHAGKAPVILISGGRLKSRTAPEAEHIAELLVEFGVPRSALVLEGKSRNTRENAVNAAAIFASHGWRTGLLVTSGTHMPRALAVFRKAGLDVSPFSSDIQARYPLYEDILDLLPAAEALTKTTLGIKEYIGRIVYNVRGWA